MKIKEQRAAGIHPETKQAIMERIIPELAPRKLTAKELEPDIPYDPPGTAVEYVNTQLTRDIPAGSNVLHVHTIRGMAIGQILATGPNSSAATRPA